MLSFDYHSYSILFYLCGAVWVSEWLGSSVFIHSTKFVAGKQKFKVLFYTHFGQEARTHTLDGILAMKQLYFAIPRPTEKKRGKFEHPPHCEES